MNTALVVEISRCRKGAEEPIHGTQAFDTGLLLLTEIAPTTSEVTRLTNVRCWLLQFGQPFHALPITPLSESVTLDLLAPAGW